MRDAAIADAPSFAIVAQIARSNRQRIKEPLMSVDTSQGNKNMDYASHEQTYALFIRLVKWSIAAVVLVLIGMAIFLI
jgi:hypothetical protein